MPRVNRIKTDSPQPPQQRVKPVQARSRLKIDAILDATADLLQHHGVDAATSGSFSRSRSIATASSLWPSAIARATSTAT